MREAKEEEKRRLEERKKRVRYGWGVNAHIDVLAFLCVCPKSDSLVEKSPSRHAIEYARAYVSRAHTFTHYVLSHSAAFG